MNLMKFTRKFIGILGFSTFHLHNNLPLNPQSVSKVILPTISSEELFTQVEKQCRERANDIKFNIIPFGKDDDFPSFISSKKTGTTWTRAPKSITPARKTHHPQSRNRRR